jgi:hypothetical protein
MGDFFKDYLGREGADASALKMVAADDMDINRLARLGEKLDEPSSSDSSYGSESPSHESSSEPIHEPAEPGDDPLKYQIRRD